MYIYFNYLQYQLPFIYNRLLDGQKNPRNRRELRKCGTQSIREKNKGLKPGIREMMGWWVPFDDRRTSEEEGDLSHVRIFL